MYSELEKRLIDLVIDDNDHPEVVEVYQDSHETGVEITYAMEEPDGWLYWHGRWRYGSFSLYKVWKNGKIIE